MDIRDKDILELLPEIEGLETSYIDSLREYFKSISYLSLNELSLEFNNKDKNHASLVMSTLFLEAKESILIFAGNFGGDICDTELYLKSLKYALEQPDININVIFESRPVISSRGYQLLTLYKEKGKPNLSISILNEEYKNFLIKTYNKIEHFTVVDNKMFRYETDVKNYKAFCNFDDEENSKTLVKNFSKLLRQSSPL